MAEVIDNAIIQLKNDSNPPRNEDTKPGKGADVEAQRARDENF